jgi:hypothetical protein
MNLADAPHEQKRQPEPCQCEPLIITFPIPSGGVVEYRVCPQCSRSELLSAPR